MSELLKLFKDASPTMIIIVIAAFFLKVYIEKRVEGITSRIDEINKTSLEVKRELRGEERGELVAFRVAVERWEDFLQNTICNCSISKPSEMNIKVLYEKDRDLFLDVKIAIVKSCTYLRDRELEQQLMNAVLKIRKNYYPIINESLPRIIDIQSQLLFYENKLTMFQKSGMKDMTFAPTEQDREENKKLQEALTEELQKFAGQSIEQYRIIAEQMYDLKELMNDYIYRPIKDCAVNKE